MAETKPKERPILFSAPMVRAILDRRKSQTRRVLKPQPEHLQVYDWKGKRLHDSEYRHWCWKGHVGADNWDGITIQLRPFLPYAVGDVLWVREALRSFQSVGREHKTAQYAATYEPVPHNRLVPGEIDGRAHWCWKRDHLAAMHMPRWASRISLRVTDVRVQRVQDIDEKDAIAEGCFDLSQPPRFEYRDLWDSLNAKRAGCSWSDNPWICAISFERIDHG